MIAFMGLQVGVAFWRHGQASVLYPVLRGGQDYSARAEHATGKQSRRDACSLLYGAARRAALALGYRRLITYTLTTESGASLRGAGWEPTATVKGADWDRPGRRRKRQEHLDRIRWEAVL